MLICDFCNNPIYKDEQCEKCGLDLCDSCAKIINDKRLCPECYKEKEVEKVE